MYPVRQRMALPGAKPPKSPFQRQSLNNPTVTSTPSPASRLSQPINMEHHQGLTRSGRDPIRRKKPVPMPRTEFLERPIDVPEDFEIAAYGDLGLTPRARQVQERRNQNSNWSYTPPSSSSSGTRPKSMVEGIIQKDQYRVSRKFAIILLLRGNLHKTSCCLRLNLQ